MVYLYSTIEMMHGPINIRITISLDKNNPNDGGTNTLTVCDVFRQRSYKPVVYTLFATFLTESTDLPHCAVTTWS